MIGIMIKKFKKNNELEQLVRAKRRKEKNDRLEKSRLQREENRIRMEVFKSAPMPMTMHNRTNKRKKKRVLQE